MDNPFFMCGVKSFCDLLRDRQCLPDRDHTARNTLIQRFTVHELQDEEPPLSKPLEIVNRSDMRMIQRRQNLSFALKS